MSQHYDYIITGCGCAGLSLAMHMICSGKFDKKQILLVDEKDKNKNDRTWCFWETGENVFEDIVFRKWEQLLFYSDDLDKKLSIAPYHYKMIRGIDFYEHCQNQISQHSNFHFLKGKAEKIFSGKTTGIVVNGDTIYSSYIFNSILFEKPSLTKNQHWLLQHFKGWHIKTPANAFNPGAATLMDFRIPQQYGTSFCYVLPFSEREALVEYTLFSPQLLKDEAYEEGLKHYLQSILNITDYTIADTEFGVIPMTNYSFRKRDNNIVNIGTAGGQTKGSSGYTFYFIQQHSKAIVEQLIATEKPFTDSYSMRFEFYDSVLLRILKENTLPGKQIFSTLFQKNDPKDVLAFLNNESSLAQELKIISSLPTLPFLKSAMKQIF